MAKVSERSSLLAAEHPVFYDQHPYGITFHEGTDDPSYYENIFFFFVQRLLKDISTLCMNERQEKQIFDMDGRAQQKYREKVTTAGCRTSASKDYHEYHSM